MLMELWMQWFGLWLMNKLQCAGSVANQVKRKGRVM
jgi:hypothetical protein